MLRLLPNEPWLIAMAALARLADRSGGQKRSSVIVTTSPSITYNLVQYSLSRLDATEFVFHMALSAGACMRLRGTFL